MNRRSFIKYSSTTAAGSFLIPAIANSSFTEKPNNNLSSKAKYIWVSEKTGTERNEFANFRFKFTINTLAQLNAKFNVFADSAYQLYINGSFVQYGPIRFDPKFPVFDAHDISKFLKIGNNVIAIIVNNYGCKTYKSINTRGGLIAWGNVFTSKDKIDLSTNSKNWLSQLSRAQERYAYKTSFALNPVDFFEQAKESENWKEPYYLTDSSWQKPEEISSAPWGELSERFIPFMSLEKLIPEKICHILPLDIKEDWYSFEIPYPQSYEDSTKENSRAIFKTYIYSDKDQSITVGTFWGELWLNNQALDGGVENKNQSMRYEQIWPLKKGWNYLYGSVGLYQDVLHQYIALPIGKGLILNADKSSTSDVSFYVSELIQESAFDQLISKNPEPFTEEFELKNNGGWKAILSNNKAQAPCRESSWDFYKPAIEKIDYKKINQKLFSKELYPHGFSITFDMGQTKLLLPNIKIKACKNAIIDITYSEQFNADGQHLNHNFNYQGGDRIWCSRDIITWTPMSPKGARFVKFTFRNTQSDIQIEELNLLSANYPTQRIGKFDCSDPMLNAVWTMGANTEYANMEDAYVDCPTRERAMYIRDTIIQYHVNLAVFGDHLLMKRCLELYGQSPDSTGKFRAVYPNTGDYTIADFSLNMVEGFKAYLHHTNDKVLIKKYWKEIINNLAWFHQLSDERADGLLDAEWHTKRKIKAHYGGFHGDLGIAEGVMDTDGIHCVFSITYLIAMQDAYEMALAINETKDANLLKKRVEKLSQSINNSFWDTQKLCYADNLNKKTFSPHASLFAVRANLVDNTKLIHVQNHVTKSLAAIFVNGYDANDGVNISPSYAFYIFDGLFKAGLDRVALDIIKQGWGWMLYKGFKTCPEYFTFDTSHCHAWSASPTYFLSKYILGIHFPEIGNQNLILIDFKSTNLNYAEGVVPHPKGEIAIKWHIENNKRVIDYIKVPEGVNIKYAEQ